MSLTYATWQQQITILAQAAVAPSYSLTNNPDFSNSLASFLDYAEGRIYKELVFLANRTQDASLTFTAGTRALVISTISPALMVVEGVAALTPAGTTLATGTQCNYEPASLDFIDMIWPTQATTATPDATSSPQMYWAMKDAVTVVVAPTPDAAYKALLTGIFQPSALSGNNTTTYLSTVYPELLLAASMISVAGWMRAFGAQADDPKVAMSWEDQYQKLRDAAISEEQRRRGQGQGWSQQLPAPIAQPPRT